MNENNSKALLNPSLEDLQLPQINEDDCGEVALLKMKNFIPRELEPLLIHNEQEMYERLFHPKKIFSTGDGGSSNLRAVVLCRVSTCGTLQDCRSPIIQAMTMLEAQKRFPNLKVIAVVMDFYKNGAYAEGRMFQDFLVRRLAEADNYGVEADFNCFWITEFSRMTRNASETIDLADKCRYYRIKLFDYYMNMDYALPENREKLIAEASRTEAEINKMGFRIKNAKRAYFLRDRVLSGKHFGFRIHTVRDLISKRILARYWVREEHEIAIIISVFEAFVETGKLEKVVEIIHEKYGDTLSVSFIRNLLMTTKYIGLVYRLPQERIRHPQTQKMIHRNTFVPEGVSNNFEKCDDSLTYRYYIKELDIIPMDLFLAARGIIARKQSKILVLPHQPNRAHAPSGENGKTAYYGLIICGSCGGFYKSGAKGFLYCTNHRKHRCGQKHGMHVMWLNRYFYKLIDQILTQNMKTFKMAFKYEFTKRIRWLNAEIKALRKKINKQNKSFLEICSSSRNSSGPVKDRLNLLSQMKAKEISEDEQRLQSLIKQRDFQKSKINLKFKNAEEGRKELDNLFSPAFGDRLNEVLRIIISRVELFEEPGKVPDSIVLKGKVIFSHAGLEKVFHFRRQARWFVGENTRPILR